MGIPIGSSPPPGWEREGIDGLLGLFPPGRLSEIVGPRSSGASSLLLALIARITTSGTGGQVALVDGMDALDPHSAAAAGAGLPAGCPALRDPHPRLPPPPLPLPSGGRAG